MLHGQKEVSFVSIIMFTLRPDALSLNGSVMIINQSIVKLDSITLIDCVVAPIGRMANVKLKQEAAVQRARWINRDRIIKGNPSETPFSCIIGTNTVGDKKQAIRTPDNWP